MPPQIFCAPASIKTAKSVRAQSNAKFMQIQNLYFFTCDLHRARLYLAIWHPTNPSQAGWERCAAQHNNVIIIITTIIFIIVIIVMNEFHFFVPSPIYHFFYFRYVRITNPVIRWFLPVHKLLYRLVYCFQSEDYYMFTNNTSWSPCEVEESLEKVDLATFITRFVPLYLPTSACLAEKENGFGAKIFLVFFFFKMSPSFLLLHLDSEHCKEFLIDLTFLSSTTCCNRL